MKTYWEVCPKLRKALFKNNRPGYLDLAVEKSVIKSTIYGHPEFTTFIDKMNDHFATWKEASTKSLKSLKVGFHPKEFIGYLSESLLSHYIGQPLIDPYDVYQHLMDYWAGTMQDDYYLIAADGWQAQTYRVIETKKGKDGKPGKEVDKGWTCDLIPKSLIVTRFFADEQAAIDAIADQLEIVTAKLAELEEEHGGDEGAFSELDKVNKANVTARLKEIKGEKDAKDEAAILNDWMKLNGQDSDLKKKLKEAEAELDAESYAKYQTLTESEIKALVVEDKWLAALDTAIHGEMDRISQSLTQRVQELAERYETPMPQMVSRVAEFESKMNHHLERMGFSWK